MEVISITGTILIGVVSGVVVVLLTLFYKLASKAATNKADITSLREQDIKSLKSEVDNAMNGLGKRLEKHEEQVDRAMNGLGARLDRDVKEIKQAQADLSERVPSDIRETLHGHSERVTAIRDTLNRELESRRRSIEVEHCSQNIHNTSQEILRAISSLSEKLDKLQSSVDHLGPSG